MRFSFKQVMKFTVLVLILALIAAGCSGGNNSQPSNSQSSDQSSNSDQSSQQSDTGTPVQPEPVTLLMQYDGNEEDFESRFKQHVEAALPHITLEHMHARSGNMEELQQQLSEGLIPDLIYLGNNTRIYNFMDLGLASDMSELVEKHNFDLSSLEPSILQSVRSYSPNGELYTLPIMRNTYVLYYNKDIFDLFSVPYPEDGMTFEDIIELSQRVTGERDGVHYYGLKMGKPDRIADALNVQYVDPETDQPLHRSSEAIRSYLEIAERMINLPGNAPDDETEQIFRHFHTDARFQEGDIAMMGLYNHTATLSKTDEELGFNYDFATYPQFPDLPGIQPEIKGNTMGVTATSEHKDAAFEVLAYILSEDFQSKQATFSRMSILSGGVNEKYFMTDYPHLASKNMDAFYKLRPAAGPDQRSRYDTISVMSKYMFEGLIEGKDINTVLREAAELAETAILDAKMAE